MSAVANKLKHRREDVRKLSFEILTDPSRTAEDRLSDAIYGLESPTYDWEDLTPDSVKKNDKRLELMRKIAQHPMAVFRYSESNWCTIDGFSRRFSIDGPFGEGLLICRLDQDTPWSISAGKHPNHRSHIGSTLSLHAHPVPGTAFGLFHQYSRSHEYVSGGDTIEYAGVKPLADTAIEVRLPTAPEGAESFTARLSHLGAVAAYGFDGLTNLAEAIAAESSSPTISKTLTAAAFRHLYKLTYPGAKKN